MDILPQPLRLPPSPPSTSTSTSLLPQTKALTERNLITSQGKGKLVAVKSDSSSSTTITESHSSASDNTTKDKNPALTTEFKTPSWYTAIQELSSYDHVGALHKLCGPPEKREAKEQEREKGCFEVNNTPGRAVFSEEEREWLVGVLNTDGGGSSEDTVVGCAVTNGNGEEVFVDKRGWNREAMVEVKKEEKEREQKKWEGVRVYTTKGVTQGDDGGGLSWEKKNGVWGCVGNENDGKSPPPKYEDSESFMGDEEGDVPLLSREEEYDADDRYDADDGEDDSPPPSPRVPPPSAASSLHIRKSLDVENTTATTSELSEVCKQLDDLQVVYDQCVTDKRLVEYQKRAMQMKIDEMEMRDINRCNEMTELRMALEEVLEQNERDKGKEKEKEKGWGRGKEKVVLDVIMEGEEDGADVREKILKAFLDGYGGVEFHKGGNSSSCAGTNGGGSSYSSSASDKSSSPASSTAAAVLAEDYKEDINIPLLQNKLEKTATTTITQPTVVDNDNILIEMGKGIPDIIKLFRDLEESQLLKEEARAEVTKLKDFIENEQDVKIKRLQLCNDGLRNELSLLKRRNEERNTRLKQVNNNNKEKDDREEEVKSLFEQRKWLVWKVSVLKGRCEWLERECGRNRVEVEILKRGKREMEGLIGRLREGKGVGSGAMNGGMNGGITGVTNGATNGTANGSTNGITNGALKENIKAKGG